MAAAAVFSTGFANDLDSCREDVLNFLRTLSWHNVCVQVERWRIEDLLHAVHRWESAASDMESLAQEIARFIVGSGAAQTATLLVQH